MAPQKPPISSTDHCQRSSYRSKVNCLCSLSQLRKAVRREESTRSSEGAHRGRLCSSDLLFILASDRFKQAGSAHIAADTHSDYQALSAAPLEFEQPRTH